MQAESWTGRIDMGRDSHDSGQRLSCALTPFRLHSTISDEGPTLISQRSAFEPIARNEGMAERPGAATLSWLSTAQMSVSTHAIQVSAGGFENIEVTRLCLIRRRRRGMAHMPQSLDTQAGQAATTAQGSPGLNSNESMFTQTQHALRRLRPIHAQSLRPELELGGSDSLTTS